MLIVFITIRYKSRDKTRLAALTFNCKIMEAYIEMLKWKSIHHQQTWDADFFLTNSKWSDNRSFTYTQNKIELRNHWKWSAESLQFQNFLKAKELYSGNLKWISPSPLLYFPVFFSFSWLQIHSCHQVQISAFTNLWGGAFCYMIIFGTECCNLHTTEFYNLYMLHWS